MVHLSKFKLYNQPLTSLVFGKTLITTLNAHCYNITKTDVLYKEALLHSDVLIPDGISVVWAMHWLTGQKVSKIAGADLFFYEMERLQTIAGKCFFLGSTESTLAKIKKRTAQEYPDILVQSYSPPYKPVFTTEENTVMIEAINAFHPDVLFIGMTAPKQEKWAYTHFEQLEAGHICCIGAVFDFYAGTINRAPRWIINLSLEWLYRLIKEPRRMWRRYLIGNTKFIWSILKEKYGNNSKI